MASIRKRHDDFIRELQAPLKSYIPLNKHDNSSSVSSSSDESVSDKQLMEELQKSFEELFVPDADDDD